MSTAFLANQLPPLSKFDGATSSSGNQESVKEWLEQFELVAGVCKLENAAKLVDLVTEAYAFYKSSSPQQRASYEMMTAALTKHFTPVRIQAVQTSLFMIVSRGRRSLWMAMRKLYRCFFKKHTSAQRGSLEAEDMERQGCLRVVARHQVAGSEVDFETLLAKAEAKLRDLATSQRKHRKFPLDTTTYSRMEKGVKTPQPQAVGQNSTVQCFGCGALGHVSGKGERRTC